MSSSMRPDPRAMEAPVDREELPNFKVVLLGPSGVGKTSLLNKFLYPSLNNLATQKTFGATHQLKVMQDANLIFCDIGDGACRNPEYYRFALQSYTKGAAALIFVFSIEQSLETIDHYLANVGTLSQCYFSATPRTYVVLHQMGERGLYPVEARKLAADLEARMGEKAGLRPEKFFQCCAKTGDQVWSAFDEIYRDLSEVVVREKLLVHWAVFKKIYSALREAQGGYTSNFLATLSDQKYSVEQKLALIQAHIAQNENPDSRTREAWRLTLIHIKACCAENRPLVEAIRKWANEHAYALLNLLPSQASQMVSHVASQAVSQFWSFFQTPFSPSPSLSQQLLDAQTEKICAALGYSQPSSRHTPERPR